MQDFNSTEWDVVPEVDPVAQAKSESIDVWLEQERQKSLEEKTSLLLLSPDGPKHDSARLEVSKLLGNQIMLGTTPCEVSTLQHKQLKKLLLVQIRPSLVLYLINLPDAVGVQTDMKRALTHFFSACRGFQFGSGTSIVVLIQHNGGLVGSNEEDGWSRIFPSYGKTNYTLFTAIEEEFQEAARNANFDIHSVSVHFTTEAKDPTFFTKLVNQAHHRLLGRDDADDEDDDGLEFFDAQHEEIGRRWRERFMFVFFLLAFAAIAIAYHRHLSKGGEDIFRVGFIFPFL